MPSNHVAMMRALNLLLMLLLSSAVWADELAIVKRFYSDYAAMSKSLHGSELVVRFLPAHESLLAPEVYRRVLEHEQRTLDAMAGKRPYLRAAVIEFDLLTGSSGAAKSFRYGKPERGRVPVTFQTTDMRGTPMTRSLTVVLKGGRIVDLHYQGVGTLLEALAEIDAAKSR